MCRSRRWCATASAPRAARRHRAARSGTTCPARTLAPSARSPVRRLRPRPAAARCGHDLDAASAQRGEPGVVLAGVRAASRSRSASSACTRSRRFDQRGRPVPGLAALAHRAERMLQIDQMTLERLRERERELAARRARHQLRSQIARQRLQLATRDGEAEEIRRHVRQLMRLVDDDRVGAGQQIAEALLLEHQIRHQQMMIDHDDVGGLRLAPRFDDVAALERRAIRARDSCRASRSPRATRDRRR